MCGIFCVVQGSVHYQRRLHRDGRPACSHFERPTDSEAVKAGFANAQEWYAHSAGGALVTPEALESNFDALPEAAAAAACRSAETHSRGARATSCKRKLIAQPVFTPFGKLINNEVKPCFPSA